MTPIEIARLEEPGCAALLASVAPEVEPFAGGVMAFHEPGSWQNQAVGVGLDAPAPLAQRLAAIDAMIEFYRSRGVEPRVELTPFADPNLIEGLAVRGFVVREFENVLARELSAAEPEARLAHDWPAGLELSVVDKRDPEAVELATELSLKGFYPDTEIPAEMRAASRQLVELDAVSTFLARVDGEPAAAGMVALGDRVAALMGVSTLPAFRRRGIQQALMVARMNSARAHGCALATIGSAPGIPTERNAMRMGFAMAYTKVALVRPGDGLARSV